MLGTEYENSYDPISVWGGAGDAPGRGTPAPGSGPGAGELVRRGGTRPDAAGEPEAAGGGAARRIRLVCAAGPVHGTGRPVPYGLTARQFRCRRRATV